VTLELTLSTPTSLPEPIDFMSTLTLPIDVCLIYVIHLVSRIASYLFLSGILNGYAWSWIVLDFVGKHIRKMFENFREKQAHGRIYSLSRVRHSVAPWRGRPYKNIYTYRLSDDHLWPSVCDKVDKFVPYFKQKSLSIQVLLSIGVIIVMPYLLRSKRKGRGHLIVSKRKEGRLYYSRNV